MPLHKERLATSEMRFFSMRRRREIYDEPLERP